MPLISVSITVSVPRSLRIPPPDPAIPSHEFSEIVAPLITRVPPALNTPPPPWLASAPLAIFNVIKVLSMFMVPVPFQSPPPSAEAVFDITIPPEILLSPAPVIWRPPPLPGLEAVVLLVIVTLVRVIAKPAPELSSIAPPARIDVFPLNKHSDAWNSAPSSIKTAPPEPEFPLAELFKKSHDEEVTTPPSIKMAPPFSALPFTKARLLMFRLPERTLKIRVEKLPSMVTFSTNSPVIVKSLSIIISSDNTIFLTSRANVIVAPDGAVSITCGKEPIPVASSVTTICE